MNLQQATPQARLAPVGRPAPTAPAQWLVAALLILVSAIPIAVAIYIIAELAAGDVKPETIRHLASPTPVIVHVGAAAIYAILGAFQFGQLRVRVADLRFDLFAARRPCGVAG